MFNISFPVYKPQTLAIKLKPSAEKLLLKSAHPWIYSDSIEKINKKGLAGDIAIIFRQKTNKILGVGLYDPNSPIVIKMLQYYGGIKIDKAFFAHRIKEAFELRKPLFLTDTNSYRLIFGENDGLPGCIVDVYSDVAVIKLYSAIWFPYLQLIAEQVVEISKSQTIVLRLSRALQNLAVEPFVEGKILYGTLKNETIFFKEHGINFSTNILKGHKTGYFLDHRENRNIVSKLAKNKTLLDVFSYNGGFSVHALAGGAKEVLSVDISEHALELAKNNAKLNHFSGKHTTLAGDAFEILENLIAQNKKFNIVVIDPPSFAKSESEIEIAIKKYRLLARLGVKLLTPKAKLVLASCSSRVSANDFFEAVECELNNSSRAFTIMKKTFHDIDHPTTYKEGAYLKCGYYLFE